MIRIRSDTPDLVVLDLGLPGLVVTRTLRRNGKPPIIMLTAHDDETDRITGLEMWDDGCVTKLFSPRELVARVRAVLRWHAGTGQPETPRARSLPLDAPWMPARRGDEAIELTATEFVRSQSLDAILRPRRRSRPWPASVRGRQRSARVRSTGLSRT